MQEAQTYEITQQIAGKFEKRAKILENNLFFIRQNELYKVNRNNRTTYINFF
jgi:hypothetical protein